jgi:hypothetical protein
MARMVKMHVMTVMPITKQATMPSRTLHAPAARLSSAAQVPTATAIESIAVTMQLIIAIIENAHDAGCK